MKKTCIPIAGALVALLLLAGAAKKGRSPVQRITDLERKVEALEKILAELTDGRSTAAIAAASQPIAGRVVGTVGELVTEIGSGGGHYVQAWPVIEAPGEPVKMQLSAQHAAAGREGAFFLSAWTDRDANGLPDLTIGTSSLMVARKAGDWSTWTFTAPAGPLFVGTSWLRKGTKVFYHAHLPGPKGYTGLSNTLFYSRTPGGMPHKVMASRWTNIRLAIPRKESR